MGKLLSDRGIRPRGKRPGSVAGFWLDYNCLRYFVSRTASSSSSEWTLPLRYPKLNDCLAVYENKALSGNAIPKQGKVAL